MHIHPISVHPCCDRSIFAAVLWLPLAFAHIHGAVPPTLAPARTTVDLAQARCVEPTTAAPPTRVAHPATSIPAGVSVRAGDEAGSFRWSDTDWIARVEVTVSNAGNEPVAIDPAIFLARSNDVNMTRWSAAATLQSTFTVPAGGSTRGTLAWYYHRTLARPSDVTVWVGALATPEFRSEHRTRAIPDMASRDELPAAVAVTTRAVGTSFRWSDGDWIASIELTLANRGNDTASVDPAVFTAHANGTEMTRWSEAATLREVIEIPAGASVHGTLAWYCAGSLARPRSVAIRTTVNGNERSLGRIVTRNGRDR